MEIIQIRATLTDKATSAHRTCWTTLVRVVVQEVIIRSVDSSEDKLMLKEIAAVSTLTPRVTFLAVITLVKDHQAIRISISTYKK